MDLYVEKEFIDKINNDYINQKSNSSLDIIVSILKEYGEVKMYIDCNEDDLRILENENLLIALKTANTSGPIPIDSTFEDYLFSVLNHEQTIIFTNEKKKWFNKLNQKGALCFCYDDYEEKINTIINDCNAIKIDLSDVFAGWDSFSILNEIPKNKIVINDGYLFWEDGNNKPIDQNVAPLLKKITNKKTKISIEVFTNYLNPDNKGVTLDVEKIKSKLKNIFRDYDINVEFIQHHEHDRIVYSNFFIIECGKGFNFNVNKRNNSKITVDSIFDKFNYKRINNHLRWLKIKKENSSVLEFAVK